MITAIYSHRQPSHAMLELAQRASKGSKKIITNTALDTKHTKYVFSKKKKSSGGAVWGGAKANETHSISTKDYPFNWMKEFAQPSAIITALAQDSDRILLMFPKNADIPNLYVFLATLFNDTVRVFRGTTHIPYSMDDLATPDTKNHYNELVLPEIKLMPEPKDLIKTPNGATLRPYQQQMVNFGKNKSASGWFVDMGLGKTLAALALLDEWIKDGEINPKKPVMIVAPITVALDTWSREVDKWGYDWNIVLNIRLRPKQRDQVLSSLVGDMEDPTLFITNPSQLEQVREYFYTRNIPLPFEVLIIDELSMFKSPNTKRSESIQHYRLAVDKFLGLTGTPSPNNLLDVWNQIKIINYEDTDWAKHNIYQFQDEYFLPVKRDYRGFVRKWKPKTGADDLIYRYLSKDVISMQTEGLVDLPSISFVNRYIELPKKAQEEYDGIIEEVERSEEDGGWVKHTTDSGVTISVPSGEMVQGKLSQIAGGAIYKSTPTKKSEPSYTTLHDKKLDVLDEIIESATSPILVFYYYQSDQERIQKRHRNRIVELDAKDPNFTQIIDQWNNGDIPVMLAHPASVGHGLNLQDGGHSIVWFTLPFWNNDYYQQANKRIHRHGQEHPVTITHILASNTIDEMMLRSIQSKEKVNSGLMEALDTMERS